jgi:thiol-disulfide isomerase/thioredoxin
MSTKYKIQYFDIVSSIQRGGTNKGTNKGTMYLFKSDKCIHCNNFLPTWDSLRQKVNNIDFVTYDSKSNQKETQDWGIRGFPTLIYAKNNKKYSYSGNRSESDIISFIDNH